MSEVEIRSEQVLFDGHFQLVAADVSYRRPDATMSPFSRKLVFERGESAAAVVVDEERGVLLLARQFRYPTVAAGPGWPLELVAGVIANGESPPQCLRRELQEEFGFDAVTVRPISTFYPSPGACSERIHLFYATVRADTRVGGGGGLAAEGEEVELVEVPLDEVRSLLTQVVDAKTLIGLSWLLLRWDA